MFFEATIIDVGKAAVPEVRLVGRMEPVVVTEKEETMDALEMIAQLKAKIAQLEAEPAVRAEVVEAKVAKNHRAVKADPNRSYVRLGELKLWGNVPQQQKDLADIIRRNFAVGESFTEAQLFAVLEASAESYEKLRTSRQHVTYLFAYYRGLKNDGAKYAGFVGRGFLRHN